MNILSGKINYIKNIESITHIYAKANGKNFSVLLLGSENDYKIDESVNIIFKETEVMIATIESIVSARNSFISTITDINTGEILAEIKFDFNGITITSIVTTSALYDLKCEVGKEFRWFIKSNEVVLQKI